MKYGFLKVIYLKVMYRALVFVVFKRTSNKFTRNSKRIKFWLIHGLSFQYRVNECIAGRTVIITLILIAMLSFSW